MEGKSGIQILREKNLFLILHKVRTALTNAISKLKIWRTNYYYVQIEEVGKHEMQTDVNSTLYTYQTQATNEDGRIITVAFQSSKNFEKGTILRLKVNGANKNKVNTISSFEEL